MVAAGLSATVDIAWSAAGVFPASFLAEIGPESLTPLETMVLSAV